MYLILAIVLFVVSIFVSINEHWKVARPYLEKSQREKNKRMYVDPHLYQSFQNDEVLKMRYADIGSTWYVLFRETPENKKEGYYDISQKHFFDYDERHQSLKRVEEVLGYEVSGLNKQDFDKVRMDYEERFNFWIYPQSKWHPISWTYFQESPIKYRALLNKDVVQDRYFSLIKQLFNDEREREIAEPFIESDENALKALSDEIGFDVLKAGRRKTIRAFADKEGWIAHTYINPTLDYPEYGIALFDENLKWYNLWREYFGCSPIDKNYRKVLIDKSQKFVFKLNEIKNQREYEKKEAERLSRKGPFYPYGEIEISSQDAKRKRKEECWER